MIDGVAYDVAEFTISFTAVTVGQFSEFLDATGYTPIPDTIEYPGFTISHFKLNYGKSPKLPLCGLTYDDAVAFCDWAGFRLPSDPELRLFYETVTITSPKKINWGGENWTSTPAGSDHFYVRNGPYRRRPSDRKDPFRKALHRHHYEQLEAPAFRVVQQ